jgi:uncharacterized membrane protein YhhN
MKKFFLILFIIASLGEIASILFGLEWLHTLSKPMLMITLGLYYFFSIEGGTRSLLVLIALFFSFSGDVLLMLSNGFIFGLASFLVSHIFYIFAYRQHRGESTADSLAGVQRVRLAFPIVLAGTGLLIVLYPVLGGLQIPVTAYTLVMCLMVLNALFRFARTNSKSFWLVFSGAVLFMISDAILAINKFLIPVKHESFLIMVTYISAQFLIVEGLLAHRDD